jgi:RNA polymerase sigma-70 factor (ECF subfamily)
VLDAVAPRDSEPDAVVVAKESIELAFLVAIQLLPPKQRAVLILRDVLVLSARETAGLLETTAAAVNAALLRARATMRGHRADHADVTPRARDEEERELVRRYAEAGERGDVTGFASLLREDVRFVMPPGADTWIGLNTVVGSWVEGGFGSAEFGDLRCIITSANRMPAVACYLRKPGDTVFRPMIVDVLDIREGKVAQITAFQLAPFLEAFGLPATL